MSTRVINSTSGRITYENNFEQAIAEIQNITKIALAKAGQKCVIKAQDTGDYTNQTGNARRLITSNSIYAYDDPRQYPSIIVLTEESDGKTHRRKRYTPPSGFDNTTVEERGEKLIVTVAAIVWYAAPLEAKGFNVLSHVMDELMSNPGEFFVSDFTDWRTKVQRLSQESKS